MKVGSGEWLAVEVFDSKGFPVTSLRTINGSGWGYGEELWAYPGLGMMGEGERESGCSRKEPDEDERVGGGTTLVQIRTHYPTR